MNSSQHADHQAFENEVRRIARQLWPEAQYAGATMVGGRERDGVFETEDCVHLLEATVSRSKQNATENIKKLVSLAHLYQKSHPSKAVKAWLVTRDEPTAEQRDAAKGNNHLVNSVSFSQFQGKLIDVGAYLMARDNYPFGSVRDPATGRLEPRTKYVPLDLLQQRSDKIWSLSDAKEALLQGVRIVVLGDYGAGKSMTLRELYKALKKDHFAGKTAKFPVMLNLRDHIGQPTVAEVLERHGRNIGFPNPFHLVRAWRAGYVILMLDGFDEVATLGIQGLWRQLHDARYRAMQVIREFVRDHPGGCGLVLAGRAHFFNSVIERTRALGLDGEIAELTLNEFNDDQIRDYMKSNGLAGKVPGWLPSRPLLVGYLAASGLLPDLLAESNTDNKDVDPAKGWDLILDRVCQRESEIEAGIDGPTVRRILERLATAVRATQTGLGPLTTDQVVQAFLDICGYIPDEKALILLQRLPGLGIDRPDEGTRAFLDRDWANACMAGDVVAYIDDPFSFNAHVFKGADIGLGTLGIGVASIRVQNRGVTSGKMNAVLGKTQQLDESMMLLFDVANVAIETGCSITTHVHLRSIIIPEFTLSPDIGNCSKLHYSNCYFGRLEIDQDVQAPSMPRFSSCYVSEVDGRATEKDLPQGIFDDQCVFEKFTIAPDTVNAITSMDLPLSTRVLLTMLKKLYVQSGTGRKENALHRGLDHHGRRLVGPLLHILESEGLVIPYKRAGLSMTIWVPDRTHMARVRRIIASPHNCDDSILTLAARLD